MCPHLHLQDRSTYTVDPERLKRVQIARPNVFGGDTTLEIRGQWGIQPESLRTRSPGWGQHGRQERQNAPDSVFAPSEHGSVVLRSDPKRQHNQAQM
jgi:hypothetical protein